MRLEKDKIEKHNQSLLAEHKRKFEFISAGINNIDAVIQKLTDFNVAIPSWALGTGAQGLEDFLAVANQVILKKKWKILDCCMH